MNRPTDRTVELLAVALRHHRSGQLAEAEVCYREILAIDPNHANGLHLLGVVAHQMGRNEQAVDFIGKAITLNNRVPAFHYNFGLALREIGRAKDAAVHYTRAVDLKPDYADARTNLGNILREQGKLDEAVAQYQQVLALKPDCAEAHNNLGNILRAQGKLDAAVACYQRALALRPDYAEAHNNLGVVLQEQGKLDDAVAQLQQAVALRSDFAQAHNNLGVVLREQGKLDDAVVQLQRSLALEPSVVEVHRNLGDALREQGKLDEAVACYQKALALKPDHVETLSGLGHVLREQGKLEAAIASCRQALALRPDFAGAHNNLGHTLRDLGRVEEARAAYQKAIELAPRNPSFHLSLALAKRFAPGDAHLAAMEKLASERASLPAKDQIFLGFALGKAYDDLGDWERSFRYLLEANALKRQRIVYSELNTLDLFDRIREVFKPELMREKRDLGDPSPAPVFIIGMPRSGTTLIEQILASHPQVFGAGELTHMADAVARLSRPDGAAMQFPEAVSSMGGEQLRQFGADYAAAVRALAPNAERITDKLPHNFRVAGFIHLVLPNARIIHARRDPLDTCLSCFSKSFSGDHPYSYDLAELGRYYRAYEALMAHWRKVLPHGVMLEVQYEDLTADLEGQARRIVAHCGLEWDDACLSFHETQRPVRTSSAFQVRQPIYRTSVGRWRPYERLLGPLIEALRADPPDDLEPLRCDHNFAMPRATDRTVELLAVALRHHRSGQLAEAEVRYREILAIDPNHANSLHLLGVVAHQIGRHEQAIDLIGKAIGLNDRVPAFHHNIGLALREVGRLEDAVAHYTRAIRLKPDYADAHNNLGNVLQEEGKLDEAMAHYQQALALRPDYAEAHSNLGHILKEKGKLDEAIGRYQLALLHKPNAPEIHNVLGTVLREQGKLAEAVAQYRQALALRPDFAAVHNNLGIALREQGQLDEAIAHYQQALALRPDFAKAHNNLGVALQKQGKLDEAVAQLRQAVALEPSVGETHCNLGDALQEIGELGDAVGQYQQALVLRPAFAQAHNKLGSALQEQGKLDEAVVQYRQALALRPDFAEAHNNLGAALREQGHLDEAATCYQLALAVRPDFAEAHSNLGEVLRAQGKLGEAVTRCRQALALRPDYAQAHCNLGKALREQGQLAEAGARYRQALALDPNLADAYCNLSYALLELGRLAEARACAEKAIELAPREPNCYLSLVQLKRFASGDAELAAMEQLASEPKSLSAEDQMCLGFALGKAYTDLGDHERSFRHLLEANALKRQRIVYDEAGMLGWFDRIRDVFTPTLMREKQNLGDPSPIPVFIIGMPRSGTTLIEQILASHPSVYGAGELMNITNAVRSLESAAPPFPEAVSSMRAEQLYQLGTSYVAAVKALAPKAARITDKMPHNFRFAGFIHLTLPHARIIHARRNPLDTCLSCFSNLLGGDHPYDYDLAELGRYYRAYEFLMEHWRKVLPDGVMLEVQYEDVTADLEGQARRIIAHCGLEWDDACLSFHETQRPVRTASAVQVRQPIYRNSVGRWRPYEHLLGPLVEALRADPARDPGAISTAMTNSGVSTSVKSGLTKSHLAESPA